MRNRMSSTPLGLQTEAFARAVLQTTANVSFHDTKKKAKEQPQDQLLQPGTGRTRPRSDRSAAPFCVSLSW